MKPTLAARQTARAASGSRVMSSPPTRSSPLSGLSMPAIRLSSVLLPDPDGPISAMKSPCPISSVMSVRTGTICTPRRYDFATWLISTSGAVLTLLLRQSNFGAVPDLLVRSQHERVARVHAIDRDELTDPGARRDRYLPHRVVLDHVDHFLAVARDDRGGLHHDHRLLFLRRNRSGEERDLCAHVRKHACMALHETHLDQHSRFRSVHRRHDARDPACQSQVGQRVEQDLARLIDVDLD